MVGDGGRKKRATTIVELCLLSIRIVEWLSYIYLRFFSPLFIFQRLFHAHESLPELGVCLLQKNESFLIFSAGGVWKAACCSCAILVGVFVSDFIHLHDCRKAAEKQSPEKDLFLNKQKRSLERTEKSEREWKINGHCFSLVSSTLENSLLAELANDRRLKVRLWRRNKKLIFIYLTTWNFVWYVLASNQVSSFCFCLVSLFPPSSLNRKRYKDLLGYWNSVGGVRFWVIATLWWFWCMTSLNGIVVVPVKNMFWLKLGVAVHPKLIIVFAQHWLPIEVQMMMMMSIDEWWWKKLRKGKK